MRRYLKAMLILLLLTVLPLSASAHPGKTDASGGHTEHSTGEYHYHHGYSAHQHTDMDGDGVVDCPYDFDDQTDHDSGGPSSNDNIYDRSSSRSTIPPIIMTTSDPEDTKEVKIVPKWAYIVMWAQLILLLIFIFRCIHLKRRYEEARNEISEVNSKYDILKKWTKLGIASYQKRNAILQEDAKKDRDDFGANVKVNFRSAPYFPMHEDHNAPGNPFFLPDGVYVDDSGKLVSGYVSKSRPYGDYTVYVSPHGRCYHSASYCAHNWLTPVHIMSVIGSKQPCGICCRADHHPKIPDWYTNFVGASRSADISWTK